MISRFFPLSFCCWRVYIARGDVDTFFLSLLLFILPVFVIARDGYLAWRVAEWGRWHGMDGIVRVGWIYLVAVELRLVWF